MVVSHASIRRLAKPASFKAGRSSAIRLRVTKFRLGAEEFLVLSEPASCALAVSGLSASECEVVGLVMKGYSNEQIARERGVRYRTVANQLASVYRKLRVASRIELIAHLHGLAPGAQMTRHAKAP